MKMKLTIGCFLLAVLGLNSPQAFRIAFRTGTPDVAAGGATDFTADGNCVASYFMNAADDGEEQDRTSTNHLAESTSDTIVRSSTVPDGYSGYSKDFEAGDTERFIRADASLSPGLDFSGSNQVFSVVSWINSEAIGGFDFQNVITHARSSSGNQGLRFGIRAGSDNQFRIRVQISGNGTSETTCDSTTTTYTTGTWYHVAFVYDDTNGTVYVNGSADGATAHTTGIFDNSMEFTIGAQDSGGEHFDGLIDEVALFDRILTVAEVGSIYTNGIDGTKGAND